MINLIKNILIIIILWFMIVFGYQYWKNNYISKTIPTKNNVEKVEKNTENIEENWDSMKNNVEKRVKRYILDIYNRKI